MNRINLDWPFFIIRDTKRFSNLFDMIRNSTGTDSLQLDSKNILVLITFLNPFMNT